MRYRPEIDGLRAASVLAVVLFHLGAKVASGGYVGVDVFFVISGYLITSLIRNERQRGEFSLLSFYVRRIKRIAPALLVMVLATIAVGYFVLSPGDYAPVAQAGLYAIGGASNFFFLHNTGYFDPHADTMPLLHTWSLGVEEQFYLVWPTLLIVLTSFSKTTKVPVPVFVAAIVAASLAAFFFVQSVAAFSLFQTSGQRYAFYMPWTRAWELGLGAIIVFLPDVRNPSFRRYQKMLPWVGLALIGAAVCRFGSTVDLIGILNVAATVGAGFIIFAIEPQTTIYRVLTSQPFVFVGKISYSLYLWHFPIIVFWRYYSGEEAIPSAYFAPFIVGVIALSWVSWRYVEEPCRRAALDWRLVFPAFAGAALTVACACWAVTATQGALARIPESGRPLRSRAAMGEWPCPSLHLLGDANLCTGGAPWESAAAHALIWGDSNAWHFMPLLDVAARQQNVSISLTRTCSPVVATGYAEFGSATYVRSCTAQQKAILTALRSKEMRLVILSAAWYFVPRFFDNQGADGISILRTALDRLLPEVSAEGRTIVIMSEIPKWSSDPIPCVFALLHAGLLRSPTCRERINGFDESYFRRSQKATDDVIRSFNGRNGVVVWPMMDSLCSERSCTTMVDGEFIYFDAEHLRRNLKQQTKLDLAATLRFDDLMKLAKTGLAERGSAHLPPSVTSPLAASPSEDPRSRSSP